MKVLITVIACAICVCNSFSQSYNNNWAFGDSCGLNFSSGEPVFFETVMESFEACASISDSAGNLLFYTNGEKVWNKNHEVMPNGEGLEIGKTGGHSSITQGVTVILFSEIAYVFYLSGGLYSSGLKYSKIDMSLDDGFGDVIEKNVGIDSISGYTQKMTVVKHANGIDWWLVRLGYHAGYLDADDPLNWLINLIHGDTIENVIVQYTGLNMDLAVFPGQMKFTQDGSMLACIRGTDLDIYTFDRCTGEFELFYSIDTVDKKGLYGCEWSPNGTKLYVSSMDLPPSRKNIYQYCIDCEVEIKDTKDTIFYAENNRYLFGQMQLGPDEKIYIVNRDGNDLSGYNFYNSHLSVINSPNLLGLLCDYDTTTISLIDHITFGSLPNMPNYNLGVLAGSECDTSSTSIYDDDNVENTITIYPNPANEYIIISGDINAGTIIKIYSADGRVVLQEKINTTNTKVNISKLPPGVYVIQISEDGWVKYSEKLFK
ncbi:MAG: T9SS type A sorting domain-containing protein [Bacteroidetes bacterium]|nr:T9SS type A sorting domain-containing protein [Bacteroidota bacterium]